MPCGRCAVPLRGGILYVLEVSFVSSRVQEYYDDKGVTVVQKDFIVPELTVAIMPYCVTTHGIASTLSIVPSALRV